MNKNKIRYIIGIICILGSFGGMSSGQPIPSIFMIIFGLSLLPIVYKKINLTKIRNAEIIIPVIAFMLFIITIAIFGNAANKNTTDSNIAENNIISESTNISQDDTNKDKFIIDVPKFNNINYSKLKEIMGEPTDTDTYTVNGKTAQIYIYNDKYEFMLYNDKLIRLTICAYEFDELKNLKNVNEFCEKLNISSYSTKNKSADTGYALRYSNFTDSIKDFWITSLDDAKYIQIKITFDSNGMNL